MSKAFQKGKARQAKINGQWIFGDFSEGLYLLDTPRSITEQLGSLALVGGVNTFCEKGALIPQYGYVEKSKINNEYIVAISKDVESGYLFLLANTGNVFLYTPNEGLKKFKTTLEEVSESALMTCRQDELIISDNGKNILFGSNYGDDATITKAISVAAPITTYTYFSDVKVPYEDKDFYWLGKRVYVEGIGDGTVTSIQNGETVRKEKPFTFSNLSPDVDWEITGSIDITKDGTPTNEEIEHHLSVRNVIVPLNYSESPKTYTSWIRGYVTAENTTVHWKETVKTVEYYAYENPRIRFSTEVIDNSYAGGSTKTKFEYYEAKILPELYDTLKIAPPISVSDTLQNMRFGQDNNLATVDDFRWRKRDSEDEWSEFSDETFIPENALNHPSNIRKKNLKIYRVPNQDQVTYSFQYERRRPNTSMGWNAITTIGDLVRKPEDDVVRIDEIDRSETKPQYVASIIFNLPTADGTERRYTINNLIPDVYNYSVKYNHLTGYITISISSNSQGNIEGGTHEFEQTGTLREYTTNPTLNVGNNSSGIALYVNGESKNYEDVPSQIIRIAHKNTESITVGDTTTISEKAYMELEWTYTPEEDSPEEPRTLNPKLIAWSCNRLFVEDMEGAIYYSTVGSADNFNEDMGAGYFQGFYGDNSELLSIEEFLGKVLLTKKNGMYTLVIGQTNSSYSTAAGTSFDTSGITIEKIAEIGQEYPNDHVIVREAIYAYDTNSASIVQAASQNVFGSIVAGTTLVSADYLSAQNFGIIDRKRCLTYNSEAQVFILYYGEDLTDGIVLTSQGSLFPRKLDRGVEYFIGFNQGVLGIMSDGTIFQDFKRNTVVPSVKPVAEFEAIGVKDNRLLMGSILEVTELNGVEYDISVTNTDTSFQHIQPYTNYGIDGLNIPPLIYSDARDKYPSFELGTKWAVKKSNLTRVYAPMSGREGVSIAFTFPANVSFCLAALRIPDLSQGE